MTKTEIVTILIRIVFAVLGVILTKVIVPVVKEWYETKLDERTQRFIKLAVKAAEQEFKGQSGSGVIKKEQVMGSVLEWLENHDIHVDQKTLSEWVEAAVYELNAAK